MTELLPRMLLWATVGLTPALLLRQPARRLFGAGPAFTLWLLPLVLAFAPLLPSQLAPATVLMLPGFLVTSHADGATHIAAMHVDWKAALIALWLIGASLAVARLTWHYVRLCSGARRGSTGWLLAMQAVAPDLDARRLRMHAAGPAVLWALPRALILLPEDFAARFDNMATRELVLRHELTHARRGDAWWTLAMEIVSALLWFHPLAWLARSRFRLDQELACDAASLRELPECSRNYAHALLDSVAVQPIPALIPWLAEPQLKERIAMITRIPPGTLRRRAGFFAVAGLLAGGLLIAGGQMPVHAATDTAALVQADQFAVAGTSPTAPSVDITFKNRNPPHYPAEAIKQGEQGDVMLQVTVDDKGNVIAVAVDPNGTTAPAVLQSAALAAAANWKFVPGTKNGKSVGGVIQIPVNFSLGKWQSSGPLPCPPGSRYKQGNSKSYTCERESSAPASS